MKNQKVVISLLFAIAMLSCEQQKLPHPPKTLEDMHSCYQNKAWNEISLRDSLIGEWRWLYTQNFWAPEAAHYTTNQDVCITFRSDSLLHVITQGDTLHTTKWEIMLKQNNNYELALEAPHQYLHGNILLCEDLLLFNNSYVDGSDNFFERTH